jgi:hypothetical protein
MTDRMIHTTTVTVTTVGSTGAAAGAASSIPLTGELLDIYLNYSASCHVNTDTVISESTFGTIMSLTDVITDGRYAPRMAVHTAAGAAITNGFDRYPLSDSIITFTLAQCDALAAALVATIRWLAY